MESSTAGTASSLILQALGTTSRSKQESRRILNREVHPPCVEGTKRSYAQSTRVPASRKRNPEASSRKILRFAEVVRKRTLTRPLCVASGEPAVYASRMALPAPNSHFRVVDILRRF